MKSIFTRPLFINPLAYLTIPELSYIQMATPFDFTKDSYSFVINTSGRIEGKLLKTSNDYILHLDLYSIDGNCVLGEFYLNNSELNTDNFNLTQSKNIITLQFGEQSSGNITYPGLIAAWSAKGKSNNDEDRATLKDLTGNGHDITLNGFAFSEMSGYGGYKTDIKSCLIHTNVADIELFSSYFIVKNIKRGNSSPISIPIIDKNTKCFITGINDIKEIQPNFQVWVETFTEENVRYISIINSDGLFIANEDYYIGGFRFTPYIGECNITIELLPEYPDALVFDGVDDYGVNDSMPIVDDYTFIIKRLLLKDSGCVSIFGNFYWNNSSKDYFWFEYNNNSHSFNSSIYIGRIRPEEISWQNKFSYNGLANFSPREIEKGNKIAIGNLGYGFYRNMAFYSAYLFDRSLDEQEIKAFIRKYIDPEYLLPSEIPTPDCYYDLSQGSNDDENRDTIKDYSGNGNDAVAHNFAWSGMSGYGGYSLLIPSVITDRFEYEKVNGKFVFKKALIDGSSIFSPIPSTSVYDDFNISINNIGTRIIRIIDNSNGTVLKEYNANGIYTIKKEEIADIDIVIKTDYSKNQEMNNLTIEFLPKYPDSLVFDGVDDYVSLDAFDSGFKTMFMVCKVHSNAQKILYDQRRVDANNNFAIFHSSQSIAYSERNPNKTFINGKNNTSILCNQLVGKKILININTDYVQKGGAITRIGSSYGNGYFVNMSLYKFLGFKEALTEEQINDIIKKYNLLYGVDEIEVS